MLRPTDQTETALAEAIVQAARSQQIVELCGEYPLTKTLEFVDGDHPRPKWFAGVRLLAGGAMWDHEYGASWFRWGGAALGWTGDRGRAMVAGQILNSAFDGVAFFGRKTGRLTNATGATLRWPDGGFPKIVQHSRAGGATRRTGARLW